MSGIVLLFVRYLYLILKLKHEALTLHYLHYKQKKRLIYHNLTSLQHLLRNKLNTEYFACNILKDIFNIYMHIVAYMNKSGNSVHYTQKQLSHYLGDQHWRLWLETERHRGQRCVPCDRSSDTGKGSCSEQCRALERWPYGTFRSPCERPAALCPAVSSQSRLLQKTTTDKKLSPEV